MPTLLAIVAARNEADRIGATLDALARAFPGVHLWVADDASTDGTSEVAMMHGAQVVSRGRPHGKGGNVTAAAQAALSDEGAAAAQLVLVCDGDLGASAAQLTGLVEAVEGGELDLAVAAFRRRVGGGFGIALRFARWAIESRCGYRAQAPISGQRAMRAELLPELLPFAPRYGMEIGMTVDAVRAGYEVAEIDLPLEHRATGKTLRGFVHRGRQLSDFVAVYRDRSATG